MDKLEKALQKAREQRKIELEQQAVIKQQAAQNSAATEHTEATAPITTTPVQEGYLQEHHIIAHHTRSQEADIFRILRTKVLQAMGQSGMKTLGITSANYGDGKTTISLNLAVSIALDLKQTVLLVDLDLRKPNITEYVGIQPQFGISDYYLHNVPISKCLMRPSFDRLTILPAGQPVDHSSEILGSPKMAALANELRTRYPDRMIIYDMPPTLAQDDPIAFLPNIDAILLVVNEGNTKINELKQSLHVLSGANVIGTVLNSPEVVKKPGKFTKALRFLEKSLNDTSQPGA
jgi:capsular exopolysaccharide synthesis family protein